MPPPIMAVKCHYCSKFRNPREVMRLTGGPIMCWFCYEWHQESLRLLAGNPPRACHGCRITFQDLQERNGDIRMYLHARDGMYQILCRKCSDAYIPKRVDLYGPTPFGRSQKLTG